MARSIHVRLDEQSESALDLIKSNGMTESEAVRACLTESAERRRLRSSLAAEAERLASDPVDREELRAIQEHLDELSPDWPAD